MSDTTYLPRQTNKRFNTFCLAVDRPIAAKDVLQVLDALAERHSMLRVRLERDAEAACGWRQYTSTKTTESYRFREWERYTVDHVRLSIEKARLSLDLENGLLVADLTMGDDDQQQLFLVARHLVVDMISWNTILCDLGELVLTGTCSTHKSYPFSP